MDRAAVVIALVGLLVAAGPRPLAQQAGGPPADNGTPGQAAPAPQPPQTPPQPAPEQPASPQGPNQQAPPERPSFRAGVELVSLNVTAADASGHYVTDLAQNQFQVFEDGVLQKVTFFNRGNLPIALSILLDTSASMEEKLETAQDAATGFIKRLRTDDLAQIIDFDSRVQIAQSFTSNATELETAIRKTNAGGSTSLYNAIYIALKELKKTRVTSSEQIRRQAIVVLSDGEDTSSLVSFDEVLELAKRSETAIYAIGLRSRDIDRTRGFNEADFVLRQLSQETGGRVFFAKQASELSGIYGQIADELSSQYTLGYTSANPKRDGAWRRVLVRVLAPNVTGRTKQGYYAPTS
jgi:Ca-activated chloride channel family protein